MASIDSPRVSLRLVTANADGFLFSSREGGSPAALVMTPRTPTIGPDPTPDASPDPNRVPHSDPDTEPDTDAHASRQRPTPHTDAHAQRQHRRARRRRRPRPLPRRRQLFYFRGNGSDHGVGMSQYGARGRAAAGQTYDEILAHYYTGTTLGTIDPAQPIRVLLNSAYMPTPSAPARIVARSGSWTSATFVDELRRRRSSRPIHTSTSLPSAEGWRATVYNATGVALATAPTIDLTVDPADATTRLEMTWRSSLDRYTLYRGSMHLLVNDTARASQAINVRRDGRLREGRRAR